MTREQQIDWLYRLKSEIKIFMPYQWQKPFEEALDMAIKAPDQEPNKSENPTGSIIDWNNCHTSEQLKSISTPKNNLAVDKEQLKTMIRGLTKWYVKRDNTEVGEPNTAVGLLYDDVMFGIDRLPQVTPQESKIGHCKDCKYFEYDSMANVDGIPLIVAHEICSKWGDGCKTRENGYCFLFEPKADMREVEE